MLHRSNPIQFMTRAIVGLAALFVLSLVPAGGVTGTAKAARVTVEFRTALDPYGHWRRHDRWGEVWVPARIDRGWRPYTVGHWVYSDDYGWYWVADRREARWGWVVYHYGRWVRDPALGWVWVPGNEWAPAWVSWRRGHRHIGWAPLPPREVVVTYRDEPDVWIFVRANDFTAPRIATVLLRPEPVYVRETVLVNRTVLVAGGGGFAVNPGIAPSIVSAVVGSPLRTYQVRPRVLAGTAATVPNAVTVQASELKQQQAQTAEAVVQETKTTIQPAKSVPEPKALADNENGRLGDNPPKAAKQAAEQKQSPESEGKTAADKPGEESGDKAAAQKQGEEPKDKSAEQKQGEEPKGKAAVQKRGEESKGKAAEQKQGEESKDKAAEQKQGEESKGKAAERKQGGEPKGRSAEQKQGGEKPAAQKSVEQKKPEEPRATSAEQKPSGKPARKSAGQDQRQQRPDAAAQKQAQPRPRQAPQQPAAAQKPETAGQSPAAAQKSSPAPAAHPGKAQGKQKPEN